MKPEAFPALVSLTDDADFATPVEAAEAIDALSPRDHKKLVIIARYLWRLRKLNKDWIEPEDLLYEAITRTLDGGRRWRKSSVSIVRHLDRVMESISGHWVQQGSVYRETLESAHVLAEIRTDVRPRIEDEIDAREQLEAIETLFAGDGGAWAVLRCRTEDLTASQIKNRLNLSDKAYETICRRIRRKLVRFSRETEAEDAAT